MKVKPSDLSVCANCTVTALAGTMFAKVLRLGGSGAITAMLMHVAQRIFDSSCKLPEGHGMASVPMAHDGFPIIRLMPSGPETLLTTATGAA